MLPGWHTYLDRLAQVLADEAPPDLDTRWRQMQAVYVEHYRLQGLQLDP